MSARTHDNRAWCK